MGSHLLEFYGKNMMIDSYSSAVALYDSQASVQQVCKRVDELIV